MGIAYNPKIVMDGLVLCLDAANPKSYPGSGTTWYDLSGRNQNFTLYNSPVFNGLYGGELRFSGLNDYARLTNSASAGLIGSYGTIDMWFRTLNGTLQNASSGNYARLFSVANATGTGSDVGSTQGTNLDYSNYVCIARNNTAQTLAVWYKNNPGGFEPSTVINVNNNLYWNVNVSWETVSSTMRFCFYYNGTLVGGPNTYTVNPFTDATTITLAMNCAGAVTSALENAEIAIGSFKLFNKTLTAVEVQQNFQAMRGRYGI